MGRRRTHKTQPLNSNSGAADDSPSVGLTWKREGAAGKARYRTNEALGLVLGFGQPLGGTSVRLPSG